MEYHLKLQDAQLNVALPRVPWQPAGPQQSLVTDTGSASRCTARQDNRAGQLGDWFFFTPHKVQTNMAKIAITLTAGDKAYQAWEAVPSVKRSGCFDSSLSCDGTVFMAIQVEKAKQAVTIRR
jgi:hypothetical protein